MLGVFFRQCIGFKGGVENLSNKVGKDENPAARRVIMKWFMWSKIGGFIVLTVGYRWLSNLQPNAKSMLTWHTLSIVMQTFCCLKRRASKEVDWEVKGRSIPNPLERRDNKKVKKKMVSQLESCHFTCGWCLCLDVRCKRWWFRQENENRSWNIDNGGKMLLPRNANTIQLRRN